MQHNLRSLSLTGEADGVVRDDIDVFVGTITALKGGSTYFENVPQGFAALRFSRFFRPSCASSYHHFCFSLAHSCATISSRTSR